MTTTTQTRAYTGNYGDARKYTSQPRAVAAAAKMFGLNPRRWWRVVDVCGSGAEYVIDTMSGYLAK